MKNVIKILKDNMLGFVIGAILFGGIGTILATTILSSTVNYTNNNQTTVEGALNELYSKANMVDGWIDPRGLNTDGTGGRYSFVYWNDNYTGTLYSNTQVPTGSGINGTYSTREELASSYANWENKPIYIKTTKVNGTVTGHAACLYYNNRDFCIIPYYWYANGPTTMNKLKSDMESALGITIDSNNCSSNTYTAYCTIDDYQCNANTYGNVGCMIISNSDGCSVSGAANANCVQ